MKALIIGNGPSALEKEMGERINSNEFDLVCRINRGWKQDDETLNDPQYNKYIGTRCDVWFCSDLRYHLVNKRINDLQNIFIYRPKFKSHTPPPIFTSERIKLIPISCEEDVNKIVNFSPRWPSTGIISIHFLYTHFKHKFKEIFIYGFDTYDLKYDNHHYFENKPNKYKNNPGSDHTPDKERYYIDYMINNNKIKLLK